MCKVLAVILVVLVGITSVSSSRTVQSSQIQHIKSAFDYKNVGVDVCPECVKIAEESINSLLELILDTGIIGSCTTLCQALGQEVGSQIVAVICNLVCDFFGIEEFFKLIDKADLDPIWYCEIAKLCPVNDHGDAKFTNFTISPATGKKGTTFTFDIAYVSVNGTGTGQLVLDVDAPDQMPVGGEFLLEEKKPGIYTERITIKAQPDPRCDPTEQPCEEWLPGIYNVTVQICNGECGSQHPHSAIYDTAKGSFELTK